MQISPDQAEAVQRMQDYIDSHLASPITLIELARISGYSPWHAERLFRDLTGKPPFEYIRLLRLSQAALQLRDHPGRILDVALDFVFDSHEGFTRAFTRAFGLTPGHYRKNPVPIPLFMPASARLAMLSQMRGENNMSDQEKPATVFVQVIERPERRLVLRRGVKAEDYYEYCEEVGCEVWGVLTGIKEALYEPVGLWLPAWLVSPGTSVYAQGVEVPADFSGNVPEGFELISLPACRVMIFQGQPFADEEFEQAISAVWAAIEAFDPTIYGFRWADEDGPRFQLEPLGYRGYIEGRPVRPVS